MNREEFLRAYRSVRKLGWGLSEMQHCERCRAILRIAELCWAARLVGHTYYGAYRPDLAIALREAGSTVRLWRIGRRLMMRAYVGSESLENSLP